MMVICKVIFVCSLFCVLGFFGHSHVLFASAEKSPDGAYALKPLKQKQMVDGLGYLLQEIYGIENKSVERTKVIFAC